MWIMKVLSQVQQDLWHPWRHIVREGLDTTGEAKNSGVTVDEGWRENQSYESSKIG